MIKKRQILSFFLNRNRNGQTSKTTFKNAVLAGTHTKRVKKGVKNECWGGPKKYFSTPLQFFGGGTKEFKKDRFLIKLWTSFLIDFFREKFIKNKKNIKNFSKKNVLRESL